MKPHPLDAIAESGRVFGLPRRNSWEFDATLSPCDPTTGKPVKPPQTCLTPKRSKAASWSPKVVQPDYPVAKQSDDRATGVQVRQTVKRFPCTVIDRVTGLPVEVLAKLITNTLHVVAYGKGFTFTKTNRGHTVLDGRTDKRISQGYARAELQRILGESAGNEAFEKLCAV